MPTMLPFRPPTNGGITNLAGQVERRTSFSSFPASASRTSSNMSLRNSNNKASPQPSVKRRSPASSQQSSKPPSFSIPENTESFRPRQKRLKSQYPVDSTERHVEYVLVASFDIDRGPVMEHQYPGAISGDEHMLAELMLPDQAHLRNQDWTIFFLHKDTSAEEDEDEDQPIERRRKPRGYPSGEGLDSIEGVEDFDYSDEEEEEEEDAESREGPPLMYVLNLVNTKQDNTVKRGAVVKAMAICTRHSFLHIYKPLLLLALEDYFKSPFEETLASLYNAVNAMDLSLMPRLSLLERHILQASDVKDMFVEKFEQIIQQRMADEAATGKSNAIPESPSKHGPKHSIPRDTHEFETKVLYNDIPIPIKVPTAVSPETVGDFSLIKLIQTFAGPHATSPQPFMLHPHLTSSGAYTHPIIVLVNAMLTQKRVIFLGHNRPSGEVAEGVLAACALASGGVLRGFTRHAFPYTDLTKIDDLLKVPGFVAGVTNPAFANHPEWWDLLCDLPTGRMKISPKIETAPVTEGYMYFQQQHPAALLATNNSALSASSSDPSGDTPFVADLLNSIASRHGEAAIRNKWRAYITRFTRISAAFEESVYGASALYIAPDSETTETTSPTTPDGTPLLRGHGYVWPDEMTKQRELAAAVSRIEGWRNTRSYYAFIQDLAILYPSSSGAHSEALSNGHTPARPIKSLDLHHHHDRLRTLKLPHADAGAIYIALSATVRDYNGICQLLTVTPESQAGLFYISLGLFHPDPEVRNATVVLLERIRDHEAGRHFWNSLGRFARLAWNRVKLEGQTQMGDAGSLMGAVMEGNAMGMGMGVGMPVGRAS